MENNPFISIEIDGLPIKNGGSSHGHMGFCRFCQMGHMGLGQNSRYVLIKGNGHQSVRES